MVVRSKDLRVRLRRRQVIDGVDLEAGRGVLGLLGPNGAGKTTLMRVLATALAPAAGELRLLDTDLPAHGRALADLRRQIGYAPQLPLVMRHLSVRDQVTYAAWLKGVPAATREGDVDRAMAAVDLSDRAKDRVRSLSGGMVRRLGIAMAIVHGPDLVLLDEPTAGLDPEQRVAFRRLVRDLGSTRTVVLSTHLVEDVAAACDRVAMLDAGRLVFTGTAEDLAGAGPGADPERSAIESGFAAVLAAARGEAARA